MLLLCGIRLSGPLKSRELLLNTNIRLLKIAVLKALDIPFIVQEGVCRAGVSGSDTIQEHGGYPFCSVGLASSVCWFSLASHPTLETNGKELKLATKYIKMVSNFHNHQPGAALIKLNGSVEIAPSIGLSNLVADIVSSGRTLRAHNLVEIKRISIVTPSFICKDEVPRPDAQFVKIMILLSKYIGSFLGTPY